LGTIKRKPNRMKPLIIIFTLFFSVHLSVFSQSCLPNGIIFSNQFQLDNFISNFPNCKVIGGSVEISGDSINNIQGLKAIEEIGGFLAVRTTSHLRNLSGLDQLKLIAGSLVIQDNDSLEDISFLRNLEYINHGIHIESNSQLNSLIGLEKVSSLGGILSIRWNPRLKNLNGLNIKSIDGELTIGVNDSLNSIEGLERLTKVNGIEGIIIYLNPKLASLRGLDNIVSGSISMLNITQNESLSDCSVESICEYLINSNSYTVIENNNSGCSSKQEVLSSCAQDQSQNDFSIYPNPAKRLITFSNELDVTVNKISIYNNLGKSILTVMGPNENLVDLSTLNNGIYLVEFEVNGEKFRQKLLIEK